MVDQGPVRRPYTMSCVVAVVALWSTSLDLSRQAGTPGAQVAAGESVTGRSSAARELPPALAWPNYAVMPDVNASTSAGIQGEVSIAIDAAQPTRAVAASMDLGGAGILVMAPVSAAIAGRAGTGRIVCIVSGGNIDAGALRTILANETP